MFLIAGWDESKISNKNAFATMFGWVLFVLAINAAAAAFLNYYNFIGEEGVVIIILASVGVLFATAIYGQIKFKVIKNSLS